MTYATDLKVLNSIEFVTLEIIVFWLVPYTHVIPTLPQVSHPLTVQPFKVGFTVLLCSMKVTVKWSVFGGTDFVKTGL